MYATDWFFMVLYLVCIFFYFPPFYLNILPCDVRRDEFLKAYFYIYHVF